MIVLIMSKIFVGYMLLRSFHYLNNNVQNKGLCVCVVGVIFVNLITNILNFIKCFPKRN